MRPESLQHIVFLATGPDHTGIVHDIAKAAEECRCHIADSRMTVLGQEFSMMWLFTGNWDGIAKLEAQLPQIAKRLQLSHLCKRTEAKAAMTAALPYSVHLIALDNIGIVTDITEFFAHQGINIENLNAHSYAAPHTGAATFALEMTVNIPAHVHLASLRESFFVFCDDRNLDAVIEPYKNIY